MAREIAVSFALNANLTGGYKAAFQGAASQARGVTQAIREMEKSPVGKLGASMLAQREKIRGLSGSLKEAQASLSTLRARATVAGGATGMLARQIEQAEKRVTGLSGALDRQLGQWRSTTAQAATVGGSVRGLTQDYSALAAKIDHARKAQTALAANRARAESLRAQRSDLNSRLIGAVGTAMTVAMPARLSIDFEDSIARVGAVANASDEDMSRLTATARQLGRDTVFTASQAAEGMKYLAMAGFDAGETIAAMPGMLDLAAAGNTDLGRTADIASDILSAFKLKAEDMVQVSDTLAKTFTTSNTSLEMLGDTMKYVGPVAATVGLSLQDTSAMAGMLGNVGIKASQAGTVMRAALLRLAAPPKMAKDALGELVGVAGPELDELYEQIGDVGDAQSALQELGMTTRDVRGNLRPMVDILEELNMRTANMGTGEKAEAFKKIFGTEASAGMMALAEQAAVTVDKYGNKIVNSLGQPTNALRAYMEKVNDYEGTGARIAKRMNNTTGGALRRLKSAWEDAGISVGNLFLPAIQGAASALSTISNVISGAVQRFPALSSGIALAVAGVASLAVGGVALGLVMNVVKTSTNAWRRVLLRLVASQVTATASTGGLSIAGLAFGAASRVAGVGARFFAGGLRSILVASGVGVLLVALGYGLMALIDNWDTVVSVMSSAWAWVRDTWGRLGVFFTTLGANLAAIFPGIASAITNALTQARDTVVSVWQGVTGFFAGVWQGVCDMASTAWRTVTGWASWAVEGVSSVWSGITTFFSGVVDGIIGIFAGLFDWLKKNFSWIFKAIDSVGATIGKITGAVGNAWDKAFGDGAKTSAAPTARAVQEKPAAAVATAARSSRFTPVAASAVNATNPSAAKKGRRGSRGASSGPVTVVTLAGDNSAPQTLFMPAARGASGGASLSTTATAPRSLPRTPAMLTARAPRKSGGATGISVDLTQNFSLLGDPAAVRKVMEQLKPDFEALVRRALEKLQSDRRRTAYAQ